MVHPAITMLQAEPALQRLGIAGPRLGLDTDTDLSDSDHGIPGAPVTNLWKGHLRVPSKPDCEEGVKSLKQLEMSTVA